MKFNDQLMQLESAATCRSKKISEKLWVAHQTPERTFIDKISIQGCEDVADFKGIIRKIILIYRRN